MGRRLGVRAAQRGGDGRMGVRLRCIDRLPQAERIERVHEPHHLAAADPELRAIGHARRCRPQPQHVQLAGACAGAPHQQCLGVSAQRRRQHRLARGHLAVVQQAEDPVVRGFVEGIPELAQEAA